MVSPTAIRPLPQKSQSQSVLPKTGLEPRFLKENTAETKPPTTVTTEGDHEAWKCNSGEDLPIISRILNNIECHLSSAVYAVLGTLPCFILGIIMVMVWHIVHGWTKHQLHHFIREFSLGVIVLNIFGNSNFPMWVHENPFSISSFILCVEAIIFRVMDWLNVKRDMKKNPKKYEQISDLQALNRYQLLSTNFMNVFLLFVSQGTLGLFYVYALNGRKGKWDHSSGWRWFIGFLVCNLAGEDEAGASFAYPFWLKLQNAATTNPKMQGKKSRICGCIHMKYEHEIKCRMVMSMVVNMFIHRIIFCTAPILMSVADKPLDFIKDCLAVFFITKLDDLDNAVSFAKDLIKKQKIDKEGGNICMEAEDEDYNKEVLVSEENLKETVEKLQGKMADMQRQITELRNQP